VALPVPLGKFPFEIGNWIGKDVPLSESILRVAQNDDYLNRSYTEESTGASVMLYVAYTARPRTMLGHRPQVCYPGSGWVHVGTERSQITAGSLTIPCLVHRFHRPEGDRREIVVLNYYVVNGKMTNDESVFSGVGWRTPNIQGDPARYVAQVQVSSNTEAPARKAAAEFADYVLGFLPDEQGKVRAGNGVVVGSSNVESSASKP
jgi:EpsI family protein